MNNLINIGYIVSRLNKGGPNNQLYFLSKYLDKSKYNLVVFTIDISESKNTYNNELTELGIKIVKLNLNLKNFILNGPKKLNKELKIHEIDIIQSYGFRADYLATRLGEIPKITTIRERLLNNFTNKYGRFTAKLIIKLKLHILGKIDFVIACSQSVKNNLKTLNLESRVITDAIEPSDKHKTNTNILQLRNRLELDIKPTEKLFITISSKLPGKNIEFLMRCFSSNPSLQSYKLLIAGYVPEELMNKYKQTDNIHFLGWVPNIKDYLLASDFFISASETEGMPNAVLESMTVGTPVILSYIPSHEEIMKTAKTKIGLLFENNNEEDLAEQIQEIMFMDNKLISTECMSVIKDHFTANRMVVQYQQLYSVIKNKQSEV
jgi:glycosyltransferase involved in cell wall biosynthesis